MGTALTTLGMITNKQLCFTPASLARQLFTSNYKVYTPWSIKDIFQGEFVGMGHHTQRVIRNLQPKHCEFVDGARKFFRNIHADIINIENQCRQ